MTVCTWCRRVSRHTASGVFDERPVKVSGPLNGVPFVHVTCLLERLAAGMRAKRGGGL